MKYVQTRTPYSPSRFELLTLEVEVESDSCVYDRLTIMGGKEMSGTMCGDRSGEVTIMEVEDGKDMTIAVQVQSEEWRWNIGITQVRKRVFLIEWL